MDLKTATSRLRRTFAYPSDTTTTSPSSSRHLSDDDDDEEHAGLALDEQEQEDLINSLAQQNAARNAQFRLLLLALPALSAVPYLLLLCGGLSGLISSRHGPGSGSGGGEGGAGAGGETRRGRGAADIWIALLALSSLASTAWTLWSLPPGVTGIRALDAWIGSLSGSDSGSGFRGETAAAASGSRNQSHGLLMMGANAQRRRRASTGSRFFWAQQHRSPLETYLPFLNLAICGLLVLAGLLLSPRRSAASQHGGHVGLANLPALIYVVVLVAKMLMGSIDPERELSSLRYEYKGA
ncbi:hypothetical protein F5B17DRAFT_300661 [Nemania serpens]|nr:hypothetical protein F5B17DRAFT_300661 [Nemania serpens]